MDDDALFDLYEELLQFDDIDSQIVAAEVLAELVARGVLTIGGTDDD
jgi:hypothetical protein